jgi:hypothetical protein
VGRDLVSWELDGGEGVCLWGKRFKYCWIKNVILEKTEVLFAMENNLYL